MSDKLISCKEAVKSLTGWETDPLDEEIEYTLEKLQTPTCTWTYCEDWWTKDAIKPYTRHETSCGNKYNVIGRGWQHCPYCGGKIVKDTKVRMYLRGVFMGNKVSQNDRP